MLYLFVVSSAAVVDAPFAAANDRIMDKKRPPLLGVAAENLLAMMFMGYFRFR